MAGPSWLLHDGPGRVETGGPVEGDVEVDHLAEGVHPGIGPPGADQTGPGPPAIRPSASVSAPATVR